MLLDRLQLLGQLEPLEAGAEFAREARRKQRLSVIVQLGIYFASREGAGWRRR